MSAADLYRGASALPNMPLDLLATGYNKLQRAINPEGYDVTIDGQKAHRSGQLPTQTEQQEAALQALGVPQPESGAEEAIGAATRGLGGAAVTMGLGGSLAASASPVTRGIGTALQSRPGTQIAAAGTGATASDIARQQGVGPIGQLGIGLGAGIGAGLAMPKAPVTPVQSGSASARAASAASAEVAPGAASSEASITASPTARATGGGHTFGTVGADPSAGLSGPMRDLAARGQELGFRMTPGQATGSRALQQMEAKLESQPMTSGPFNTLKRGNQELLNRLWAEQIGVRSNTLDDATLGGALLQMEKGFQQAADDVVRPIDPGNFFRFVIKTQQDARGLVRGEVTNHPLFEDTIKFATEGGATGEQLHALTSKLGTAAYNEMSGRNGDRQLGAVLYQLKDYVDDLLVQGMSQERVAQFSRARGNYRNLMLLTQRAGVVNPSSGNVSGRSLANVLQQRDRRGFLFGRNQSPAYDAARFAQGFAPIVGDSGTATRSSLPGLTEMVVGIPLNMATRVYTSSPGVRLAVQADASARAARNYARGLGRAPTEADVPPSVVANQASERRRRRIAQALAEER